MLYSVRQFVERHIGTRSFSHCCCENAINIKHYFCMWICLCIQHAMRMRSVAICRLSGCNLFFYVISWTAWFSGNVIEFRLWFPLQYFSNAFLSLIQIQRDTMTTEVRPSSEVPFILVRSQNNLKFSPNDIRKNSNVKFHENPFSGSLVPCGRTDRQTDR